MEVSGKFELRLLHQREGIPSFTLRRMMVIHESKYESCDDKKSHALIRNKTVIVQPLLRNLLAFT
jgi:hypothetical protein